LFWGSWYSSSTIDSFENYSLDIAYAAIADSMPEILALIGDDTAPKYYSEKSKTGTIMNADEICKQSHNKYTDNGNGTHNTPACERCGLEGKPENHTFVYNKDTNTHSCICGAIDNTGHFCTDNGNGTHTITNCTFCNIQNATEDHRYEIDAETGKYQCICGAVLGGKDVPDGIDYIVLPHEFINQNPGGNATIDNGIKVDEDGTVYRQILLTSNVTSNYFKVQVTKGNNLQGGRYLVYKVRTNIPNPNNDTYFGFALHDGSVHKYHKMPDANIFTGDWVMVVVDLEAVFEHYKLDENGNYPVMNAETLLCGWGRPAMAGYTVDMAYLAIVDSIDDVMALIDGETEMNFSAATEVAAKLTQSELCATLAHKYVDNGDGTHNTPACERCGLISEKATHTFVYDAATDSHICVCGAIDNTGHSCTDNGDGTHTVANCKHCGIDGETEAHKHVYDANNPLYVCVCGNAVGKTFAEGVEYVVRPGELTFRTSNTYSMGIFVDDDGTVYQKISDSRTAGNNFYEFGIGKGADLQINNGRYFVMKVRSSAPLSADAHYRFWMNGQPSYSVKMPTSSIFVGDWVIYVIDLEKAIPSYYVKDASGNYPVIAAGTFIGGWTNSNFKDSSIDIAYVAIVDCIDDVIGLLESENNVYFSTSSGNAESTNKSGLCGKINDHSYTINSDGTHTTPSCDKCGLVGGTTEKHNHVKNADGVYTCACGDTLEDVAHYVNASDLKVYANRSEDLGVTTEDGVTYHRFGPNPNENSTTDLCFMATNIPSTNTKYVVIKLRTNIVASTNYEPWFNLFGTGVDQGLRFKFQSSFMEGTEWTTFVIDLEKALPRQFDAEGNLLAIPQFVFSPYCAKAFMDENSTIDVAYMAFCSSIDGVIDVIDQETVVYQEVSDGNGNCSTLTVDQLAALGQTAQ
jgi:hypothetical protein